MVLCQLKDKKFEARLFLALMPQILIHAFRSTRFCFSSIILRMLDFLFIHTNYGSNMVAPVVIMVCTMAARGAGAEGNLTGLSLLSKTQKVF